MGGKKTSSVICLPFLSILSSKVLIHSVNGCDVIQEESPEPEGGSMLL